ncbi:helix-turn-helix domain-containing protein, partial [Streptomyces durbertensis]
MARWRPLPDGLPPEVRRFVERLRLLKDRTGLSLTALAAKSGYSASSWYRYLGAASPPPWEAVAALARAAGLRDDDLARLRVMWEAARETSRTIHRPATAADTDTDTGGSPAPSAPG